MARREMRSRVPGQRQLKVGELVRRALAGIIERMEFEDPLLRDASITVAEVRMSPDCRNATVFVLPLGGQNGSEAASALNREQRRIRKLLNREITLKFSPRLAFVADEAFDRFDAINRLIADDQRMPASGEKT